MKHLKKLLIKAIIFVMLSSGTVLFLNQVLTPKYFYNNTWPTTSTYLGFYKMERNTVDVLFFGCIESFSFVVWKENIAVQHDSLWLLEAKGLFQPIIGCDQILLLAA